MSGRRKIRTVKIPGRTRVPGQAHKWIPCSWSDCDKDGYDEIKIVVREPKKTPHYIFCSDAHKSLYINSHRDYGNYSPLFRR